MDVVGRGLVAAGLGVYAAIHLAQAVIGPDSSPGWLTFMFVLTALVAAGLAVAVFTDRWRVVLTAASALAVASAIALVLSLTSGLFGVSEVDLGPETLIVLVAEVMVLLGTVTALFGDRFDLDEGASMEESAV